MLHTGTTTFECKSGYGLSREGELRSLSSPPARRPCPPDHDPHRAPRPRRPRRLHRRHLDGRGRGDGPGGARRRRRTALDIFVESIAFSAETSTAWAQLATANNVRLRAHVEQFSTMRSVPVALSRSALARPPVGHPPRRHRSARALRHRRRPAPRRRVHGRGGHRPGADGSSRPARSSCWPPTPTRAPRRSSRCR